VKAQLRVLSDPALGLSSRLDADFLRHILANAPIVIFAFDSEGIITFS